MTQPKTFEKAAIGFNHNIAYKGTTYHVQTEDSGLNNPHVTTHLFVGGNILASKKTSYSSMLGLPDLQNRIRELMESQHKEMLKNLVAGAYHASEPPPPAAAAPPSRILASEKVTRPNISPPATAAPQPKWADEWQRNNAPPAPAPPPGATAPQSASTSEAQATKPVLVLRDASLDEAILAFIASINEKR